MTPKVSLRQALEDHDSRPQGIRMMTELVLQTPEVFKPLDQPSRYKGAYGGRGSGKSWHFASIVVDARLLICLALMVTATAHAAEYSGSVNKVVDGDTFWLCDATTPADGKSKLVSGDRFVAQCFAQASDIATTMVEQGFACDRIKFSGGHYSQGGNGKSCEASVQTRRFRLLDMFWH